MLTVLEQRTYEAICSLATTLEQQVPKAVGQLNRIVGALEVIGSVDRPYRPKEDPNYCMSFDEWASRLGTEDRRRIMNLLWNDEVWHDTCLREEEYPWDDWSKSHPDIPPEPPKPHFPHDDNEDLPF